MHSPVRPASTGLRPLTDAANAGSGEEGSSTAVKCTRPGQGRLPKLWWEAHHLALPVCTLAGGPPVARHLAAASRALRNAVSEAWGDLARRFPCRLYVVGGIDQGYHLLDTVERYDPLAGAWEALPRMDGPRAGAAAAVLAGRLYVLGGEARGQALRDVQRFDPWTGAWEALPPMHCGRIRAAAVACDGFLYVLGGLDGSRALRSAERYDPRTRTWQVLGPMHRPRYACAATLQDGCIYAFGGELTESGVLASAECYNPYKDGGVWELLPAVRAPNCGAAIAVSGGQAFTFGGLGLSGQALCMAEQLNLDHDDPDSIAHMAPSWEQLPPMPTARHLASASAFRGGVVVVGGKGASFDAVRAVELFHPDTKSWEVLPPLPSPRLRAAVAGGCL